MRFLAFLRSYSQITTGISLAAFCVAGYVWYLRSRHVERLAAIQKATGDAAVQLVNGTLTAFNLRTEDLTDIQRFKLAKHELDRLGRKQLYSAVIIMLVALLLAVLTLVSVVRKGIADEFGDVSDATLQRDIRQGTPAARESAIRALSLKNESARRAMIEQIAREMLAGQGVELCNLMLAAATISPQRSVDWPLQLLKEPAAYQLTNPVCTSISNPDFSNISFSKIEMVRPNLVGSNFTRGQWREVAMRDDPDYTGKENSECRIAQTPFNGADIESSSFSGCNLSHVSFNSATLVDVNFHRTILDRVDFRFSNTSNLRFLGSHMKHVDLRNLKGDVKFALGTVGEHVRMDFSLAQRIGSWPTSFEAVECVSELAANQCWDLVSEDNPECQRLAHPRTFVVAPEKQVNACKSWARKLKKAT